ncbi:MAG: restriction endonuclease [Gemmatimonadota bacterium]|nr:MAG: restriction endonuclease [Gemmatimonadota bacterium]
MPPAIDEAAIRSEVLARGAEILIRENWLTPSGRARNAPMYEAVIENPVLKTSRVVSAKYRREAESKAREQLVRWAEREIRQRVAEAKRDLKAQAAVAEEDAKAELQAVRDILRATLTVNDRIDWNSLIDRSPFRPTTFSPPPEPEPPRGPFFIRLLVPIWRRRLAVYHELVERHRTLCQRKKDAHDRRQAAAQASYETARDGRNARIRRFRESFEAGDPASIEEYVTMVFERSSYPASFSPAHDCQFDRQSGTLVVGLTLPVPDVVPRISGYRAAKGQTSLEAVEMKKREFDAFYDDAVKLSVLRTMHEVFEAVYLPILDNVVVNGWTTATNRSTGHDERQCIISVSATRESFEELRLDRVDPSECVRSLRGLVAGPLSQLAPVRPILEFDRHDDRFVESKDILDDVPEGANLAEMPWEDFEHLVRELFGKMFSEDGAEVKVTRASRDAGVDAVAFDPDPIRGGKFVIQAKRYTHVVGVSAVRDLYGTMMNEGAARGILVTTSHYGADSRDFAKDKPITLIDGPNLVHLLGEHGYTARIDLPSRRPRAAR